MNDVFSFWNQNIPLTQKFDYKDYNNPYNLISPLTYNSNNLNSLFSFDSKETKNFSLEGNQKKTIYQNKTTHKTSKNKNTDNKDNIVIKITKDSTGKQHIEYIQGNLNSLKSKQYIFVKKIKNGDSDDGSNNGLITTDDLIKNHIFNISDNSEIFFRTLEHNFFFFFVFLLFIFALFKFAVGVLSGIKKIIDWSIFIPKYRNFRKLEKESLLFNEEVLQKKYSKNKLKIKDLSKKYHSFISFKELIKQEIKTLFFNSEHPEIIEQRRQGTDISFFTVIDNAASFNDEDSPCISPWLDNESQLDIFSTIILQDKQSEILTERDNQETIEDFFESLKRSSTLKSTKKMINKYLNHFFRYYLHLIRQDREKTNEIKKYKKIIYHPSFTRAQSNFYANSMTNTETDISANPKFNIQVKYLFSSLNNKRSIISDFILGEYSFYYLLFKKKVNMSRTEEADINNLDEFLGFQKEIQKTIYSFISKSFKYQIKTLFDFFEKERYLGISEMHNYFFYILSDELPYTNLKDFSFVVNKKYIEILKRRSYLSKNILYSIKARFWKNCFVFSIDLLYRLKNSFLIEPKKVLKEDMNFFKKGILFIYVSLITLIFYSVTTMFVIALMLISIPFIFYFTYQKIRFSIKLWKSCIELVHDVVDNDINSTYSTMQKYDLKKDKELWRDIKSEEIYDKYKADKPFLNRYYIKNCFFFKIQMLPIYEYNILNNIFMAKDIIKEANSLLIIENRLDMFDPKYKEYSSIQENKKSREEVKESKKLKDLSKNKIKSYEKLFFKNIKSFKKLKKGII